MSREPNLTDNAKTVLQKRYLWKDQQGRTIETAGQLMARVAKAVSEVEKKSSQKLWNEKFHELIADLRFLPNTPTLINAGKKKGQLSACFVLPVEDSLESIFETLKRAAKVHQTGGGTGFAFSRLRAKGSTVESTHGVASGPVSFIKIYDASTEIIKQGGARRGANMAVLRVDHPDIFEFVDSKRDLKSILNFNISVGATHEFMSAVEANQEFALKDPHTGKETKRVSAWDLFDKISQAAWESGDPGLVFLDRIALFNPTPEEGEMESTNPCGEQPLLPYESCNLGSLNLVAYVHPENQMDWKALRRDIWTAVRFLDNVIDANHFPIPAIEKITLRNRKIGLGVMGLADALLKLGIPYGHQRALELGEKIMSFIDREAKHASMSLAKEKGPFKNWKKSLWDRLGYAPLRNATVSTVAPTGTISIIAGVSSGIEPIFSGVVYRNVLDGQRLVDVSPTVRALLLEKGIHLEPEKITDTIINDGLGMAWTPAPKVTVEEHIRMQAAFQRHSDSAVSKTVNLPESASVADVSKAYLLAYRLGCKGITIYRDKSRGTQVLERAPIPVSTKIVDDADFCPSC
ncbi:adenosylcobalamin-dependent ribonucleoside-diphosphate reductase [bacterium]|nr:adenosylcobalamin-dependent ribonucleoside-diphosphate reductase [bacterium]